MNRHATDRKNCNVSHAVYFTTLLCAYAQAQDTVSMKLNFEPDHGFFDQEIRVSILVDTQCSAIHYTLDGSAPAIIVGQSTRVYQDPIAVNQTSVIRAIAIFPNDSTSEIMTQTYLFVDDIIQQDYQAILDAGFPSRGVL